MNWQEVITEWLAASSIREWVLYLLMNVPGFPPIVQTIHIAAVAVVMGSVVFVALRNLGIAVPSQQPEEMLRRLMPWVWWALLALFLSGIVFVIARPDRYFYNPVAGWKVACLIPAILTALTLQHRHLGKKSTQALSALLLVLVCGVVFAGRWIAYADYLYWE